MIELMVVMAILAILAGAALPSFNTMLDRRAIQGETGRLIRGINLARSKAVTGGVVATIQHTSGTAGDWSRGWQVFVDDNGDGSGYSSEDELISAISLDSRDVSILSTGNADQRISFNAQGRLLTAGGPVILAVCDTDHSTKIDGARITINPTGRTEIEQIAADTKAAGCTP